MCAAPNDLAGVAPLERARALGPVIHDAVDLIEQERRLPASLADALTSSGLCKLSVPTTFGGEEADPATLIRVIEEIARADGSTAWCLMTAIQFGTFGGYLAPAAAGQIFADPGAFLAGVVVPVGRASVVDGGYRVTGRWKYASGCLHATWLTGACVVYDGDAPRAGADGKPENRWAFVPVEDCTIIDTWHVSGLRGTGSHDFVVEDLFVPAERTTTWGFGPGGAPEDRPKEPGPLYAFGSNIYRTTVAGVSLGIARGAHDAFIELVSGPGKAKAHLRDNSLVHTTLGQAEAELRAARAFLYESVNAGWEQVLQSGDVQQETWQLMRLASKQAGTAAAQSVEALWYATGAAAIFDSNPLERRFRDVHAASQRQGSGILAEVGAYWLTRDGAA
jgi:indole-3-acetate monooxygenase